MESSDSNISKFEIISLKFVYIYIHIYKIIFIIVIIPFSPTIITDNMYINCTLCVSQY